MTLSPGHCIASTTGSQRRGSITSQALPDEVLSKIVQCVAGENLGLNELQTLANLRLSSSLLNDFASHHFFKRLFLPMKRRLAIQRMKYLIDSPSNYLSHTKILSVPSEIIIDETFDDTLEVKRNERLLRGWGEELVEPFVEFLKKIPKGQPIKLYLGETAAVYWEPRDGFYATDSVLGPTPIFYQTFARILERVPKLNICFLEMYVHWLGPAAPFFRTKTSVNFETIDITFCGPPRPKRHPELTVYRSELDWLVADVLPLNSKLQNLSIMYNASLMGAGRQTLYFPCSIHKTLRTLRLSNYSIDADLLLKLFSQSKCLAALKLGVIAISLRSPLRWKNILRQMQSIKTLTTVRFHHLYYQEEVLPLYDSPLVYAIAREQRIPLLYSQDKADYTALKELISSFSKRCKRGEYRDYLDKSRRPENLLPPTIRRTRLGVDNKFQRLA